MTINEKLQFLDEYEKSNGSRLFKKISMPRSTVDSAMKGPYQPRYSLLEAVVKNYSHLNVRWLFFDDEEVWVDGSNVQKIVTPKVEAETSLHDFSILKKQVQKLSEEVKSIPAIQTSVKGLKDLLLEKTDDIELISEKIKALEILLQSDREE